MMTLEMYMMHQTEQRPTRAQDPLRKAPNAPILFPFKVALLDTSIYEENIEVRKVSVVSAWQLSLLGMHLNEILGRRPNKMKHWAKGRRPNTEHGFFTFFSPM